MAAYLVIGFIAGFVIGLAVYDLVMVSKSIRRNRLRMQSAERKQMLIKDGEL